jgi:methylated-DNA-[protein]-cysteine S-methyltransferase
VQPGLNGHTLRGMATVGFTLFDTPIGRCGLAWGADGICDIELPGRTEQATRARLRRTRPDAREMAAPPEVQQTIQAITSVLSGSQADLSGICLDMHGVPEFERRVYELARTISPGSTRTYGELASQLGDRRLAREVGQALGHNPFPIVVPCHRVVAANGRPGGFSAPGGQHTKLRLLALENTSPNGTLPLFAD